jgi:hypothetical protein
LQDWVIAQKDIVGATAVFHEVVRADFPASVQIQGSLKTNTKRAVDLLGNATGKNSGIGNPVKEKR